MDKFFEQDTCDRCHGNLKGGRIMSMFNNDCICMNCKDEEVKRADYKKALDTVIEEENKGNRDFKGIGL